MDSISVIQDAFSRVRGTLHRSLSGLTRKELHYYPHIESNTIAWLAWHLTRIQDDHLADLAGTQQEWIRSKWYERFSLAPDPTNTGGGHTTEQVREFVTPDCEVLLAYHDAVYTQSCSYLETVRPTDLDRILNEPQYQPLPTVGVRLVSVISDNSQHAGQIAYLRGLLQGRSWLTTREDLDFDTKRDF